MAVFRLDFTRGQPATFEVLSAEQARAAANPGLSPETKQLGWIALAVIGVVLFLRK